MSDADAMNSQPRLQPGVQVRCPRCRRPHPLIKPYDSGTEYTLRMLFVECRGGRYYVGQEAERVARAREACSMQTAFSDELAAPTDIDR